MGAGDEAVELGLEGQEVDTQHALHGLHPNLDGAHGGTLVRSGPLGDATGVVPQRLGDAVPQALEGTLVVNLDDQLRVVAEPLDRVGDARHGDGVLHPLVAHHKALQSLRVPIFKHQQRTSCLFTLAPDKAIVHMYLWDKGRAITLKRTMWKTIFASRHAEWTPRAEG